MYKQMNSVAESSNSRLTGICNYLILFLKKTLFFRFKKNDSSSKSKGSKSKIASNIDEDSEEHGGWRRINHEVDLKGGIEILFECDGLSKCYLAAQDNGKFTVGAKHFECGEQPNPEEILTLIKSPDDPKIRFV